MDKTPTALNKFVSRYMLSIVMVPSIIALHIGWSALQKNRALVKESGEMDLPVVIFFKYCLKKFGPGQSTEKVAAVKSNNS